MDDFKIACSLWARNWFHFIPFMYDLPINMFQHTAHGMAICCNTHNLSNWDFYILRLVTNTHSFKMLCPQKNCLSLYFHKNITCLSACSVEDWSNYSFKTVYQWVTTRCCFMSNTVNVLLKLDCFLKLHSKEVLNMKLHGKYPWGRQISRKE